MTETIKIFLPTEFYDELLYQYEDKDSDLRKLVFGYLKPLAKQGKMTLLNKMMSARVEVNGKMEMKDFEMNGIDLKATSPKSDKAWIPEKVSASEIQTYEISISSRLYEDLKIFADIFCARYKIYNEHLDSKAEDFETKKLKMPACFEQIIQDNVVTQLSQAIAQNIDKEYDDEFNEMEKTLVKPKPKGSR